MCYRIEDCAVKQHRLSLAVTCHVKPDFFSVSRAVSTFADDSAAESDFVKRQPSV